MVNTNKAFISKLLVSVDGARTKPRRQPLFSHSLQTIAPSKQCCDQVTTWVMFLRQTSKENLSQSSEHNLTLFHLFRASKWTAEVLSSTTINFSPQLIQAMKTDSWIPELAERQVMPSPWISVGEGSVSTVSKPILISTSHQQPQQ